MFPATTSPMPSSLISFLSPPSQPPPLFLSSLFFSHLLLRPPCSTSTALTSFAFHRNFLFTPLLKPPPPFKSGCFVKSTAEDQLSDSETRDAGIVDFGENQGNSTDSALDRYSQSNSDSNTSNDVAKASNLPPPDVLSLGIPEPVYQVVEVKSDGIISTKTINRRNLLKTSGLRPRDIRSVDPSLWLTNSMPSLLVREHAILLNLGSLRAIVMQERVLIFNYNRRGGKAFIDSLLPRLTSGNTNGGLSMPFVLEVVEAALVSRIQRYEQRMMEIEPRVSMATQFNHYLRFSRIV